jgi:hypothetical protein
MSVALFDVREVDGGGALLILHFKDSVFPKISLITEQPPRQSSLSFIFSSND